MTSDRRLLSLNSKSVISLLGVVALVLPAGVLGAIPSAAATVLTTPGVVFNSIACSSTICGAAGQTQGRFPAGVAETITNGILGKYVANTDALYLNDVTCPTSTECLAVGSATPSSPLEGRSIGDIVTFGQQGSNEQQVPGTAQLNHVNCATATQCVATGTNSNGLSDLVGINIVNGVLSPPFNVNNNSFGSPLGDIACPNETTCYVVGQDSASSEGFLVPVDVGTLAIGAEQLVSGSTALNGIFCSSTTTCVAAGSAGTSGDSTGVVITLMNGTLGTAQLASGTSSLDAIACASATLCEAVGPNVAGSAPVIVPFTEGEVGSTITPPSPALYDVACPDATSCEAVGVQLISSGGEGVVLPLTFLSTTVALPSNGATISGGIYLDAAASDNVSVTQVNYVLTGSTYDHTVISGSTPTYVGWLGGWNSTTVPNGTYALQSVATDVEGFTTMSDPITVTVNNPPPTTTVALPSNGATVSGGQWLDGSTSPGVNKVQYELTGGTLNDAVIATATPTIVGWLSGWDTTTVPNGTYTLQSVASYAGGVTGTSAPITITINNLPPSTVVGLPSSGATISGGQWLDASASPGVTNVVYELTGGTLNNAVIATATPTYVGWLAGWDTSTVPNGTYTLQSVASYAGGVSGTSAPVTVTVNN